MRYLYFLILIVMGLGALWYWEEAHDWSQSIVGYIENGDIYTLEAKYTPDQIMELHRQELLGGDKRTYLDPVQKFSPYLLMEVKYMQDGKSREGVLLWGMEDGEMVLNTDTWETTHGFADCIHANACHTDFRIINALVRRRGVSSREELRQDLNLEEDIFNGWIESARQKYLIVQKGSSLQLHFENPKIAVLPQTKMKQALVFKTAERAQRNSPKFSKGRIVKLAKAAFGNDFTVRREQEVYLPVYTIGVQNPDGSMRRSDWNALNGQQIIPKFFQKS